MINKNGQVTLFVIIAIVIVVGASLFFILRDDKSISEVPAEMVDVKIFVDSCVEAAVHDNSYLIGENGGYIDVPEEGVGPEGGVYYFYQDKVLMPTRNDMEEVLSEAVARDIALCSDGFKQFAGKSIEVGEIEIGVEISDDEILYDVIYPLTVKVGEGTSRFSDFGQHSVSVRLGLIHSVIEELIRSGDYSAEKVCASCFASAAYDNDLSIDLFRMDEGYSVFVFRNSPEEFNENNSIEFDENYPDLLYEEEDDKTFKYVFASDY